MPERSPDGVEGFIPELVRKAVERSVKALLQSEEGMRGVVHAVLPRDLLSNLTQQVDGAKRELTEREAELAKTAASIATSESEATRAVGPRGIAC